MATTKIIFKYSWIYDHNWQEWSKFYYKRPEKYPLPQEVKSYMAKAERVWRTREKDILTELFRISGLKWKEEVVYCYVVGNCIPFSDPLTLKVYKNNYDYFTDVLTHEMVHQLFTQKDNEKKAHKAWKYFHKKYSAESFNTRIHILVHAFHKHIFLKFFGEKRLKDEMNYMSIMPDYKRAWDIVEKEGYTNIIKEFKKRVVGG